MPVISRFYGIIIRMYFTQAEHNPPHIHAVFGDDTAEITIQDGILLEGHLPPKAFAMVREWIVSVSQIFRVKTTGIEEVYYVS